VALVRRPKNANPYTFWDNYLKTHEMTAEALLGNILALRREKEFIDIEAALRGFLRYRTKNPDPWMYEMLAIALAKNERKPEDVKQCFNYAADIALQRRNVVDMTRLADEMFIHKLNARVPELLEESWKTDPAWPNPVVMAINFANHTHNPQLMGEAVEQLLSLGWPGADETMRTDARRQVETLAKALEEENRGPEAQALLNRLPAAEARDLFVRLTWEGDAWIDLVVDEPLGATAKYTNPRTVFGGAIVKSGRGKHPESVYTCPRGFDGKYVIRIEVSYNNPKDPAGEATLEIFTHEGTREEKQETTKLLVSKPKRVTVTLTGGRRTAVLPYLAPPVAAQPHDQPAAKDAQKGNANPPARGEGAPATARPKADAEKKAPPGRGANARPGGGG
jgi:hypothetical protein